MAKKDAMGQEVDSLYLSLGLNAADLEMGFQTAGQTVRQAMSRLNSEAKQIQLKADIDVTRLEAAGNHVDALKAKEKALTDELAVQQKKLELLNRAYEANAKDYGKDASVTRGVDTKRLYQTRDIERLKASIAQVNAELAQTAPKATSAFGKLGAAASGARAKVEGITGAIKGINAGIAGASAAIAGGYGLFSITDKAMNAGENLYRLSQRLHTTTGEASKLSKVFQLSGTDINSVVPIFARLDKQALAATKTQNSLSLAMGEFGFSLTDTNGNLLSYEQQLSQLAQGYQKAVAAGREAEFVQGVLGSKGAALIPLLQDYATNMEIVSRIKGTGLLDPKEAHELYIEWQAMQMQAGQLTGAIGQALLPVAKELMPEITAGFAEFAKLIADNKEGIKAFGSAAGTAVGGVASALTALVSILGDVKNAIGMVSASSKDLEVFKELGLGDEINKGKMLGAIAGGVLGGSAGPAGALAGAGVGANVGETMFAGFANLFTSKEEKAYARARLEIQERMKKAHEEVEKERLESSRNTVSESIKLEEKAAATKADLEEKLANTTSKKCKEQLEAIRDKVNASIEEGKTEAAAWASVADDIAKAMKAASKEAKEANEALEKSIYSLTHNDLQNSFRDIDYSAKAALEKGADPSLVEQEALLKKSKAVESLERETAQYLDSIYADSLTQRLNQIEREKQAWIKKGMDEVTATRAAEQQKKAAVNDSVKNMFTTQKKYLDIYRRAMAGEVNTRGAGYLWEKSDSETRQRRAISWIRSALMEEAGVDEGEWTDMKEVLGFQRAMKEANNWGMSMIRGGTEGFDTSELTSVMSSNNEQVTGILGQINSEVPQVNANLLQILGAIQQTGNNPPQINVNPVINVDLGGAYVFDNAMRKQLTDDITNDVARGVTSAVEQATSRINASFAN